jgi:methionyl aminopeptidase
MQAFPTTPRRSVPKHIARPPYAATGFVPISNRENFIYLHNDESSIARMRRAAQLACQALHLACNTAAAAATTTTTTFPYSLSSSSSSSPAAAAAAGGGMTTDDIDAMVHDYLIQHGAYPSPLNYSGFPKSLCSSINEVICHGIPDTRPLQFGDVVSFDVSCFLDGVHGDNCATIIVGDVGEQPQQDDNGGGGGGGVDWRGVPYKTDLSDVIVKGDGDNDQASLQAQLESSRRLIRATRESLYAAIETCRPDSCLSDIGTAIETIANDYGYSSVQKYRGHGICHEFHCAPYVKHYKNDDVLPLRPGMIFTIEPMLVAHPESADCYEWDCDQWTVVTTNGTCAAQFEHTILITDTGYEILTQLPDPGNDDDDDNV